MKVGIIIVTYNSQKDIGRLLDSIIIQDYKDLTVYIVDNNSTDNTLELVSNYESELSLKIISSKLNNGFARGNNIGIQRALDESCDLVFILNPDIQLKASCINILVNRIKSDEEIGVIGPVVLLGEESKEIIQSFGVNVNFKTQKKVAPYGNMKWSYDLPAEIFTDYVLGGAMMVRSEVLKVVGLFEEDYFMYNDELDIAYRVKKAGYKTLCLRDAIAIHFHDFSRTNKNGFNLMYYYVIRNRYLYFKKFRLFTHLTISLLSELFSIPLKIIWSIRRMGNLRLLKFYYSGLLDGLRGINGIAFKSFDGNKRAKEIILTIDHELFLGKETGKVKETMIEPAEKLLSILEKNGSKMTVFWDILHYHRLLKLEKKFPKLSEDRVLIENQILELARRGHDIQLHLHPHWLDAEYQNNEWVFHYDRFKLHNLSDDNNPEDINTILGCITISKALMENLIRRVNVNYKVTTFRAGGYLIEPFEKLKHALQKNEIRVDSSVCTNLSNDYDNFSFNFCSYPAKQKYNFDFSPKIIVNGAQFTEIPITTVKIPALINIYFTFLRIIKYPYLESERKGSSTGDYFKPSGFQRLRKLSALTHTKFYQLSTDGNFKERFDYKFKKVPGYSTMILHPKLLNSHNLYIINEYITDNKIKFISINDFL